MGVIKLKTWAKRQLLAKDGRLLAEGQPGKKLTADKWLELYEEVRDDTPEAQAAIFDEFEKGIRIKWGL
jgi:hypothetical protein